MASIILDDHKELFRSETDFEAFVSIVKAAGNQGKSTLVWANQHCVASLGSPIDHKAQVHERMRIRLAEEPELLDDVTDRHKHDEVVDWD